MMKYPSLGFEKGLEKMATAVSIADPRRPDVPLVYVNEAFTLMTGYEASEVIGQNCRFLQGLHTDRAAVASIRSDLHNRVDCDVCLLNYRKDGTSFHNFLSMRYLTLKSGQEVVVGCQYDIEAEPYGIKEHLASVDGMFLRLTGETSEAWQATQRSLEMRTKAVSMMIKLYSRRVDAETTERKHKLFAHHNTAQRSLRKNTLIAPKTNTDTQD